MHVSDLAVHSLRPNNRVALKSLREYASNLGDSPTDRALRSALELTAI